MNLDKEHGEFNFGMFENEQAKLQYQARFHEDSEAVHKLHYEIKSIPKLSKRARKHQRNKLNRERKTTNGLIPSGRAVGVTTAPG